MASISKDFGINVGNLINQAVEMQIDSKLGKAAFDSTLEGVVIEIIDKINGIYLVKAQSATFTAYSTGGTYYVGDVVYVNVPKNDMNSQKFIMGRKAVVEGSQNLKTFNFKYPFDSFVSLWDLINSGKETLKKQLSGGYLANKEADGKQPDGTRIIENDPNCIFYWKKEANRSQELIGSTLGVEAAWTTYLGEYAPVQGNYGIRFLVKGDIERENGIIDKNVVREFFFKTEDMYGNPYTFQTPYVQQKLINLSEFNTINEIAGYFWQDHNFISNTGEIIPYYEMRTTGAGNPPVQTKVEFPSNILYQDLKIFYGLSTDEIDGEKVFLYTQDDKNYGKDILNSTQSREILDKRTMHFLWVHKDEKVNKDDPDTYTVINDSNKLNDLNAHIYWYQMSHNGAIVKDSMPYIPIGSTVNDINNLAAALEQSQDDEEKKQLLQMRTAMNDELTQLANENAQAAIVERYQHALEELDAMTREETDGEKVIDTQRFTYGGQDYIYLDTLDNQFSIERVMDINQPKEKFKAVIVYNGTYEVSDPLIFYNYNLNIENDANNQQNELILRCFRAVNLYKSDGTVRRQKFVIDDNIGNFFVYDENNKVIKNDDEISYSDMYYYIQAWIYSKEVQDYVPLYLDDGKSEGQNENWQIYWSVSDRETMITAFDLLDYEDQEIATKDELDEDDKNFILVPQGEGNAFKNAQAITRKFKIASYWNVRYINNVIGVTVRRNGRTYSCTKTLQFGQSGSTGSAYTIVPILKTEATREGHRVWENNSSMCVNKDFQITVAVYDQFGNLATDKVHQYTFELLNTKLCQISVITEDTQQGIYEGHLNSQYPPLMKITCIMNDTKYNYPIYTIHGFMCFQFSQSEKHPNGHLNGAWWVCCPNRIEYKSDGTSPVYSNSDFIVHRIPSTDEEEIHTLRHSGLYIYPQWYLEQEDENTVSADDLNRVSYINGILYNNTDIKHIQLEQRKHIDEGINDNDKVDKDPDKIYYTYRLDPYHTVDATNSNKLRERQAFFWDESMAHTNFTYLSCTVPASEVAATDDIITIRQVIAFAHNVYPSSLVNSWDGQLLIDKQKNAILAKMIAAGGKDSLNQFSGVIMGNWAEHGDLSIDPIGLYGFASGIQTFGFKADGSGFIGPAGSGQIVFDGTLGLISDYYRTHYINLNPINYILDENEDRRGSYSQYFLYAQNKKLKTQIGNGNDYGYLNTRWANRFDNDHDYFIVDPNNGVYMSGGIIARYGKIGDCLELSGAGLTYKKNNGIIFMGQERRRNATLIPENENDRSYDTVFWASANDGQFNYEAPGDDNDKKKGRYIFWAGGLNEDDTPYSHPNFGIEHNGVVHLAGAYISGAIRATSLDIIMPDGKYHDTKRRFAATYYSNKNPANKKSAGGICISAYGDQLLEGDIWYDTSKTINVKSLQNYALTTATTLTSDAPATASTVQFTAPTLNTANITGYNSYEWSGDASGEAPTNTTYDGWKLRPALSADTLTQLSIIAEKSSEALNTVANKLGETIKQGYDSIRQGMSPLSFYTDGDCYVHIANTTHTNIEHGIGSAPPGISIFQMQNGTYTGSAFFLNGARMGFYKSFSETNVSIPLLAYYNGNIALAGSLVFGMDIAAVANNASGTGIVDSDDSGLYNENHLYQNELDGRNCTIKLGNGTIILDGGRSAAGYWGTNTTSSTRVPSLTVGGSVGAKVLIGANSNDNVNVQIGALGNAQAKIQLAGYDIIGNTNASASYNVAAMVHTQDQSKTGSHTYSQINPSAGTQSGTDGTDDTWTVSSSTTGITVSGNYTWRDISSATIPVTTINNLQNFSITNTQNIQKIDNTTQHTYKETRAAGITIYEKKYFPTAQTKGTTELVFAPTAETSYLSGWTVMSAQQINAKSEIFCEKDIIGKTFYQIESQPYGDNQQQWVTRLATEKWVMDNVTPIIASVAGSLNDSLTSAVTAISQLKKSKAPYNHSHS